MARLSDLYDDFRTVGLDETKWEPTRDFAVLSTGGLRLNPPAAVNAASGVITVDRKYDIKQSAAYIRIDGMISATPSDNALFYLINETTGKRYTLRYSDGNLSAEYLEKTGGEYIILATTRYNAKAHKWWRIQHTATNTIRMQVSPNGSTWRTIGTVLNQAATTGFAVSIQAFTINLTAPSTGSFTIGSFNTKTQISRGPGYLSDTFDYLPLGNILYGRVWGPWKVTEDGAPPTGTSYISVVSDGTTGRKIRMAMPADKAGYLQSNMPTKIKDVDITIDMRVVSQAKGAAAFDYESPRITWRQQSFGNHYEVIHYKDYIIVQRLINQSQTQVVANISIGSEVGMWYRYRILHVGNRIIVWRNSGGQTDTGMIELVNATHNGITAAGNVGLMAQSATVEFDNLKVLPGVEPLAPQKALPIRAREWGTYASERINPSDPEPTSMLQVPKILTDLEAKVGKRFSSVSYFCDLNQDFPTQQATDWANQGRESMISVEPYAMKTAGFVAGTYDAKMRDWANEIKKVPGLVYLRPWPEMNGDWIAWSLFFDAELNGIKPEFDCETTSFAQFQAAWRRMVDVFRGENCTNVRWVFCVNEIDFPKTNLMESYYPGNDYVDVLSLDGYNWGKTGLVHNWRSPREVYLAPYNRLVALSDGKRPIWITETGAKEPLLDDGARGFVKEPGLSPKDPANSKAKWVNELMNETGLPLLERIYWFSIEKERDWRMTSTPSTLKAFKDQFSAAWKPDGVTPLHPETNPQAAPQGYNAKASAGQVEYLRFEEVGYQPLVITPSYGGIWLTGFDLGGMNVRDATESRALSDGSRDYTKFLGPKSVTLEMLVKGTLDAEAPYYLELVNRWLSPLRRPNLVYKLKGQPECTIKVRGTDFSRPLTMENRESIEVQASFFAQDGKSYTTNISEVSMNAKDVEPTAAVTLGSAATEPIIRIYGPCKNPVVYNISRESEGIPARLGFDLELAGNQFVEINTLTRSIQLNGWADESASLRSRLVIRDWFVMNPFRNQLRLMTADDQGTATVLWRDSYS